MVGLKNIDNLQIVSSAGKKSTGAARNKISHSTSSFFLNSRICTFMPIHFMEVKIPLYHEKRRFNKGHLIQSEIQVAANIPFLELYCRWHFQLKSQLSTNSNLQHRRKSFCQLCWCFSFQRNPFSPIYLLFPQLPHKLFQSRDSTFQLHWILEVMKWELFITFLHFYDVLQKAKHQIQHTLTDLNILEIVNEVS